MAFSRRKFVIGGALAAAAGVNALGWPRAGVQAQERIAVATTVGMIADLVRNTGGDRVEVTALMGPGVDPHLYKPSSGDVDTLSNADIIFYGGLHLEGRMVETFEGIARSGKPTFAVTAGIPEEELIAINDAHDPHVWFDVSLWMQALDEVVARLSETYPEDAELFQTNA